MHKPTAKVLVVEDSAINVAILVRLLQDYDVMVALDGETALRLIDQEKPDVVLLNIIMPGLDGFEVCRRIRARPHLSDISILFITSRTDDASIVQAFAVGGSDYVTKPFHRQELLARVHVQVQSRRLMGLRTLSVSDPLTGLPNRQALCTEGLRMINLAHARGRPLAALMLEIDQLKRINIQYDCAYGDEVLRRVAKVLIEHTGHQEQCARIGGNDFALLIHPQDDAHAVSLAERLRTDLAAIVIDSPQGPFSITVSIGICRLTAEYEDLDTLLAQADLCRHVAKRGGGNQVSIGTALNWQAPERDRMALWRAGAQPEVGRDSEYDQ
jgi:two-component system, cell cycle response regulator